MRIIGSAGREDIARVYLAEIRPGRHIEFVESLQPPLPRSEKWVLIVSTMLGCPVGCAICDAGGRYAGNLSAAEIFSQIHYLVGRRFPTGDVAVKKFKIQFARMGEPSLNPDVLAVLDELPHRYNPPGLMPSISSVAPAAAERFFERLLEIKRKAYSGGRFQLQFSLHTTDRESRDMIMPIRRWDLPEIAAYGDRFCQKGDRKVVLNFAPAVGMPLEAAVLARFFNPAKFVVKLTPINPTHQARQNRLRGLVGPSDGGGAAAGDLRAAGFEVIVSVGELEENLIGSNCGQYVRRHLNQSERMEDGYTYDLAVDPNPS
jgi:23S rRNA (adenine2503-C2)-methyltransferase